jgi:hypothetical protein
MKIETPAIDESPVTRCETAMMQNEKVPTKVDEAGEEKNPSPVQNGSPRPTVSFYEAACYWVLTRS